MINTQHTPGPWELRGGFLIYGGEFGQIANVRAAGIEPEATANAHLIAAAPKMFEVLQQVLDWCASPADTRTTSDIEDIVTEAIDRALGDNAEVIAKRIIEPVDQAGDHKTGSLPAGLSPEDITATLGFPPNIADDYGKVTHSWGFTVDGVRCGIWDYKGSRWSTYDPQNLLPDLFSKIRGENAGTAA
jgi:hypothetical protein